MIESTNHKSRGSAIQQAKAETPVDWIRPRTLASLRESGYSEQVELRVIILMGVSGCGKTTIGQLLSDRFRFDFFDGDDFHPPENRARLERGAPLTDADRLPWLNILGGLIQQTKGAGMVLACSALKQQYRDILCSFAPKDCLVEFVHLRGSPQLIAARLSKRRGHFMNPSLLASQFEALEAPSGALTVGIEQPPAVIAAAIAAGLGLE